MATDADYVSMADIREAIPADRLNLLGAMIREERGLIIERWARAANEIQLWPSETSRDKLLDDLPQLVECIGLDLFAWNGSDTSRVWAIAETHGEERWKQDWMLRDVVRDYQLLRTTLIGHLVARLDRETEPPLMQRESQLLNRVIDEAIVASVETYSRFRDGQLRAMNAELEFRVRDRTSAIRELAAMVTEAEVRERERVAAVLHENVQQMLFAARVKAASLAEPIRLVGDSGSATAKLEAIQSLLESAIEASRNLATDLAPPILLERGLVPALHWLADRCNDQFELGVETTIEGPIDRLDMLTETERTFLFRFAQECLLNAAKHSEGSQVHVRLMITAACVEIQVIDDGPHSQRLEQAFLDDRLGFGLADLQRRAHLFGGKLSICRDTDAGGSCVSAMMPLEGTEISRDLIRSVRTPVEMV